MEDFEELRRQYAIDIDKWNEKALERANGIDFISYNKRSRTVYGSGQKVCVFVSAQLEEHRIVYIVKDLRRVWGIRSGKICAIIRSYHPELEELHSEAFNKYKKTIAVIRSI